MRRLAIGFLLTVVIMCLACDDIAIGENPITVVGDTVYVFASDDDEVEVYHGVATYRDSEVNVYREIEGGVIVRFVQRLEGMSKVVISVESGSLYTIPMIRCQGYDDCDVYISFHLNEYTLSGLAKGTE